MFASAVLAFVVAVGLTPLFARWARRRNLLDVPNHRSSHVVATPRTGGVAFVLAALGGLLALYFLTGGLTDRGLVVAAGAVAVAGLGLVDDFRPLPAAARLLVQVIVAAEVVAALGGAVFPPPFDGWIGAAAAVFWLTAATNAYNFMDGIDGIAGAQAVVAGLGWVAVGRIIGSDDIVMLGGLAAAACGGFLLYNWQPARVFMGDAGSGFLGFLFGALALVAPPGTGTLWWYAVLLLWPFLVDTGFTMVHRIHRRQNLLSAHRSHLYQRLILTGLPHWRVSLLYGVLAVLGAAAALAVAGGQRGAALISVASIAAAAVGLWRYVVSREARGADPLPAPAGSSK